MNNKPPGSSDPDELKQRRAVFEASIARQKIVIHLVSKLRAGEFGVSQPKLKKEAFRYALDELGIGQRSAVAAIRRKCVTSAIAIFSAEEKFGKPYVEKYAQKRRNKAKETLAGAMRRNETPSEKAMRVILTKHFPKHCFRSQRVLFGYIPDFYSIATSVVVEVDGSVHDQRKEYDANRDAALKKKGIVTFRFSAEEVLNSPEAVLEKLRSCLPPAPEKANKRKPKQRVWSDGQTRIHSITHAMHVGQVETKGKVITVAPPIWRKFLGQSFGCLTHWLSRHGEVAVESVVVATTR